MDPWADAGIRAKEAHAGRVDHGAMLARLARRVLTDNGETRVPAVLRREGRLAALALGGLLASKAPRADSAPVSRLCWLALLA